MKLHIGIPVALLFAASSAAFAAAAPEDVLKVPIMKVHSGSRPSTVRRWRHTLQKYGLSQRPRHKTGPQGHQRGRVEDEANLARIPLVDYDFDREYYGTVKIGQPPQAFKIDFDTGSSQFIISSKGCTECSGTTHYDPSVTFKANGKPWKITYGDQSHAEGILGHDLITLDDITVENQQLALVTNESIGFDDTIDGIMSLAFGSLSSSITGTKTVFENMMAQNVVEREVFSFYLGKASLNGGGVIFGGMDMSRVEPGHKITYTPVTRAKYWQINVENVLVNGKAVTFSNYNDFRYDTFVDDDDEGESENDDENEFRGNGDERRSHHNKSRTKSNIPGIMDTGTTLMIIPQQLSRSIHRKIHGAVEYDPSWTVPCDLAGGQGWAGD
ncbi:MAG: aspartic peptidase domain-containing protein [Benniella sp.]|nr:MAG: aspartic peptidase domain-containing protein [Benniella sp.]